MGAWAGLAVVRPELLLLLVLLPAFALAWRRRPPAAGPGRSRLALALRLVLVALLVLSLAGVRVVTQPQRRALIAVVDLSASTRAARDQEAAAVSALVQAKRADDLFGVVTFGHQATVELPPTATPVFDGFQTQPDPGYTDIEGALRLAVGLIPDGYARQLVLVSDGRQNLGDAATAVAALRAEGVRVDVRPAGSAPRAEVLVAGVQSPHEVHAGQSAEVAVDLNSTGPATGTIDVSIDGEAVASRAVTIPAGSSVESFQVGPLAPGLHQVRAALTASPDTYSQNNVGEAILRVVGPPRILILEGAAGGGDNMAAALSAAGMAVTRRLAAQAPTDTAAIARFDSVVVVDAAADQFPAGAMEAIAAAAKDLGHGLVTIGGADAYGPGGWQGTPLEAALPVSMELPPRKEKPKVAVVLVMETMEDQQADQVAIGAARAVIDQLSPQDLVAVTDGSQGFAVPMTRVGDRRTAEARLGSIRLGDSPSYLPFVAMAGQALQKTDAVLKHIVVLGDGDATPDGLAGVVAGLRRKGITTSAIGVNIHGSQALMATMADLARAGGGRFFQSNDPSQVPQVMLEESRASLRPWFEQFHFFPRVTSSGDLLAGVPLDAFPALGGYVVTSPKPAAEVYLASPKGDPVLAAWRYGLGRAVAWTSDAEGRWTNSLLAASVGGRLLARMVAWSLPDPAAGPLAVQTSVSGDGLEVAVSGTGGGTVRVTGVAPDLSGLDQQLAPVAPGRWRGRLPLAGTGAYLLHVSLLRSGAAVAGADLAVAVPYPPEYRHLGRDDPLLAELAHEGGRLLANPAAAWSEPVPPFPVATDVGWLLLVLAAVLWPLDVAVRRLMLTPAQLMRMLMEVVRRHPPSEVELAVPAELAGLRTTVQRYRRQRSARGAEPVSAAPPPAPTPARPAPVTPPRAQGRALSEELLERKRRRRAGR
ncbi:MAG: VWA domain-containing protein [Candidatus Dormibacteraceae bacterium]